MCLPCNFNDETHAEACCGVRAAEAVHYIELLAGEFLECEVFQHVPGFNRSLFVVVLVFVGCPPYGVLACFIVNDEFVLRRTSGVDTSHYVYSSELGFLSFLETFEACFGLFFEKDFIGRVVKHFLYVLNAILAQIQFCHVS